MFLDRTTTQIRLLLLVSAENRHPFAPVQTRLLTLARLDYPTLATLLMAPLILVSRLAWHVKTIASPLMGMLQRMLLMTEQDSPLPSKLL